MTGKADGAGGRRACTDIHRAAARGWTETVARLLDGGVHIEARNDTGRTPLSLAVKCNRTETVRLLIERGADVNTRDDRGWTPIRHYHRAEVPQIAVMLVEAGAGLDETGLRWWRRKAARKGYAELTAVLADYGAAP